MKILLPKLQSLIVYVLLFGSATSLRAQGTAFTYQGRLNDSGAPYTGNAEFQATLWNAASAGAALATNSPPSVIVPVANGLFVLPLDFGANFSGGDRWLQFEVRTTIGSFTTLAPRQKFTPTPYAITASNLSGTLPAAQLSGTLPSAQLGGVYSSPVIFSNAANVFGGSGAGLTLLDASQLTGGTVPSTALSNAWKINGNSGTSPTNGNFLGTTDNRPLEVKVYGQRVIRLERQTNAPAFSSVSPNIIGGFEGNSVAGGVNGATIAGGGGPAWYGPTLPHAVNGDFSTIGGGVGNVVYGVVSTIAGGERGTIGTNAYNSFLGGGAYSLTDAADSTIGGGRGNAIQSGAYGSTIGGGSQNIIRTNSSSSFIGGGSVNTIQTNSGYSTIAGGYFNTVQPNANYTTIPGGYLNSAAAPYSFAAGSSAQANHSGAFVWADSSSFSGFASTAPNQFSLRANGGVRLVTGGAGLTLDGNAQAGSFSSSSSGLSVFGDIGLESGSAAYHHLRLSGGNSTGFLFGSYPYFGDGVHLSYNFYADAAGGPHVVNAGGGSSRITAGYGAVVLAVGNPGFGPNTVRLTANASGVTVNGTFNNSSDRNAKQDFAPVNPSQILEKVAHLPLSEWSYKDDPATRHVGPMGQDFYSTFNVGTDEKHIAPIDEGGVALAAIQGLNQKLEKQLKAKDAEIAELRRAVAKLARLVKAKPSD